MNLPNRLFIVEAHPDDTVLTAGGLIQKMIAQDKEVLVATATYGQGGFAEGSGWNRETLAVKRKSENEQALGSLGVSSIAWLGYEDGFLEHVDNDELLGRLLGVAEDFKPDLVLSFGEDGLTGHPDHREIAQAGKELAYSLGHSSVLRVATADDHYHKYAKQFDDKVNLYYLLEQNLPALYRAIDTDIDLRLQPSEIKAKLAALTMMDSQYSDMFDSVDRSIIANALARESFVLEPTSGTADVLPLSQTKVITGELQLV